MEKDLVDDDIQQHNKGTIFAGYHNGIPPPPRSFNVNLSLSVNSNVLRSSELVNAGSSTGSSSNSKGKEKA